MYTPSKRLFRAIVTVLIAAAAGSAHAQLSLVSQSAPSAAAEDDSGVLVENHPTRSDVKFVKFYSPLLGRETTTRVWLPPNYGPDGEPVSTLYFLHGTTDVATLDKIDSPGQPIPRPGYPFGPSGSGPNAEGGGEFLDEPASRATFLVVYPDLGGSSLKWCGHCWWVDGRNGKGVAAESHIYKELIPVIEQTFNVRRGRNGRAVSGKSMGANGALLHSFRHPDWWRFALAFSPTEPGRHDLIDPPNGTFLWLEYLVDQGYGDYFTDQVHYENIEPYYIAQNVVGTGLEVLVDIGSGCVPPENDQPPCAGGPEKDLAEFRFRASKDIWTSLVTERGVDLTYVVTQRLHNGPGQGESYRRFFADRVERMFATPAPAPALFSYSTVDTAFSAWGWDLRVERPTAEFLHLSGARTDGTAITLAGTGVVTVTTPPLCGSSEDRQVLAVPDGVEGETMLPGEIIGGNRLRFTIDLGPRDPAVDQRRELVENGKFNFPRTRIRIVDTAPSESSNKKKPSKKCS